MWNQMSYDPRTWTQFLQLRMEALKIQDFNGVWTRDLAIPVRRSNVKVNKHTLLCLKSRNSDETRGAKAK